MNIANNKAYQPRPQTAKRYGVADRTISRWEADPKLNFPEPMIVNGRKFDSLEKLEAWEIARASQSRKAA